MPLNFPPSPSLNQLYTAFGKSWRWNGEAWESYISAEAGGKVSVLATNRQTTVVAAGTTEDAQYLVGLADDVAIPNSVSSKFFNINGATFSGSPSGATLGNNLNVSGNINITGTLLVDGLIVSKTGFSGFTANPNAEPVTDVSLDGGEF